MSTTPNLLLPLLETNQAQKTLTLNQSLTILDALHAGVVSRTTTVPPTATGSGLAYIVPDGAGSVWAGHTFEVAYDFESAWVFLSPTVFSGLPALVQDEGKYVRWDGSGSPSEYQVVGFAAEVALGDEIVKNLGTLTADTILDLADGTYFVFDLDAVLTLSFNNPPGAGFARGFSVEVTDNGGSPSSGITWPAAVEWAGGTAPSQTVGGTDLYVFVSIGGGRYVGSKAVEDLS